MPCDPLDTSNITPAPLPPDFSSGGFSPQLPPSFNTNFPPLPIEDLIGLFDKLNFILPPGVLKPSPTANYFKDSLDGIISLLEKFIPFLMLYKFITPILNLIVCIIDVLCAIPNPFKLRRAIRRLFRNCLPEFLAIFPFLSVIVMIISLLLLIIAIVLYLIKRIEDIVNLIKENIEILAKAEDRLDADSIIAITKKIGDLLCLLQNLFPIFGVLLLIIQVIKALVDMTFKIPCNGEDGTNDGCCTTDVCPSFIKNNETIVSSSGKLQYFNQVAIDSGLTFPPGFAQFTYNLRSESWQFYDPNLPYQLYFNNITHAFDLPDGVSKVFFPTNTTYTKNTVPSTAAYTVDIRLFYVPSYFGRVDIKGSRYVRIKDCIVIKPPVDGVSNYQNDLTPPNNGTLYIEGGRVCEDDGSAFPTNETLNSLIHKDPIINSSPVLSVTDGYLYDDISYTFKINHNVLLEANLITLGCVPDVSADKESINFAFSIPLATNKVKLYKFFTSAPGFETDGGEGGIPNIENSISCVLNSINNLRSNISIDSLNQFSTNINNCLNSLKDDCSAAVVNLIGIGFDQYNSDFSIDPSIQFTTRSIKVKLDLLDNNKQPLVFNSTQQIAELTAKKISPNITFGKISDFVYDGYQSYIAEITSETSGNGQLSIAFDNKFISNLNNPPSIDDSLFISIKKLDYTFVFSSITSANEEGAVRRDDTDVVNNGD